MPQSLCLSWGVRVAQAVNSPEIGRASRPIRVQLVVLLLDDDENDLTLHDCLPQVVLGYLLK